MFILYHKMVRWHSKSIYSLGTKQLAYLLFYINRCFQVQLCSCLARAAEGKHEQIAAIPTLFLVLEALPCKCYFFFFKANLTPSNTSSKLLPTLFMASRTDTRKIQVLPSCSLPQSFVTSKSWNLGQGYIHSLFLPQRNQRENISLWFPTGLTSV